MLQQIEPQQHQRLPEDQHAAALLNPVGAARCALFHGKPIAAAGVVELWRDRGYAWALLGVDAAPHLLPITREIRSFLDALPCRRVEMAVDPEFPQALRWARMLGFERETPEPMRSYYPDGRSAYLYARVREDS